MRNPTAPLASLLIVSLLGVAACSDAAEEAEGPQPWDLNSADAGDADAGTVAPTPDPGPAPQPAPEPGRIPAYPSVDVDLPHLPPGEAVEEGEQAPTCTTTYRSNTRESKVTTVFGPHGPIETYYYDSDGTAETPTRWHYDDDGNLVERVRGEAGSDEWSRETWTYVHGHMMRWERESIDSSGELTTESLERTIEGDVPVREDRFRDGEPDGTTYYVYRDEGRVREEYWQDPTTAQIWDWRYTYDGEGRLLREEVTSPVFGGSPEQPVGAVFSYDSEGRLQGVTYLTRPDDWKRFEWTDGGLTRGEGSLYGASVEMLVSRDPETGSLRYQEGWQDGQSLVTWSYEGDACWKSALEFSLDMTLLAPGSAGR